MMAQTRNTALVALDKVQMRFGDGDDSFVALDNTDLVVNEGDFVALVGPSGCGKSTILKLVAGLLEPSSGTVTVEGEAARLRRARMGMAFQNPTMLPWLTIRENVMLPLKIVPPYDKQFRAKKNTDYRRKVDDLLEVVGLADFADKQPWALSGGMLQRANLCRALIHEPKLLMLDEPFGALDQFTREELWDVLQQLWMETRPTVFLVTHDLREAIFLANRILVMSTRPGRVVGDQPSDFARPRTLETSFEPAFVEMTHDLRRQIIHERAPRKATS